MNERVQALVGTIRATPEQKKRLTDYLESLDELELFMREQRVTRRITRKEEEEYRIEEVKTASFRASRKRVGRKVLETEGHKREIKKVKTTASKLEKDGRISRALTIHLDAFAKLVAQGHGAATDDGDDSTHRLTSSYEGFTSGGGFGSKTLRDVQISGLDAYDEMRKRIPKEMLQVFDQIVDEEVAGYSPFRRTLTELGERLGYKHKQASPSGGTLVYTVVCMIAHYMREKGIRLAEPRQNDADFAILEN